MNQQELEEAMAILILEGITLVPRKVEARRNNIADCYIYIDGKKTLRIAFQQKERVVLSFKHDKDFFIAQLRADAKSFRENGCPSGRIKMPDPERERAFDKTIGKWEGIVEDLEKTHLELGSPGAMCRKYCSVADDCRKCPLSGPRCDTDESYYKKSRLSLDETLRYARQELDYIKSRR